MVDWNWYLSSVAQSAAAIVAIGAAFVVSRVLSAEADHSRRRSSIEQLLLRSRKLADRASASDFVGYNTEVLGDALDDLDFDALNRPVEGEDLITDPEYWWRRLAFSDYHAKADILTAIAEHIEEERAREREREAERQRRQQARAGSPIAGLYSPEIPLIESDTVWAARHAAIRDRAARLRAEAQSFDVLYLEIKAHIREMEAVRTPSASQTSVNLVLQRTIIGLGVIFAASVVMPLSVLPQPMGTAPQLITWGVSWVKLIMIAPLAAGFYWLLWTLIQIISGLTTDPHTETEVRRYQEIRTYSQHFCIREENAELRAAAER